MSKRGVHWLGPEFEIGLDEKLIKFREIQKEEDNFVISTPIL